MEDILGASRLGLAPLQSFTVLLLIPANIGTLFSQVIEETGTRPRRVSFKPTIGLNLQMFTYSSSAGREGELGLFILYPWIRYYIHIYQVLLAGGWWYMPLIPALERGGRISVSLGPAGFT